MYLRLLISSIVLLLGIVDCYGENWPAYNHDVRRSGVTRERLAMPLAKAWEHRSAHAPSPAWPEPAKADYWHRKHDLNPRVTYDRAYHVTGADDVLFYGSSSDDAVVCLDATTGAVRWRFWTEGPIRLAPCIEGDRVYVGSDDGWAYCLGAADGKLRWKYRAGPDDRKCLGNGRMISRWPIRSSIMVQDGTAYFSAGLFPAGDGAYLCAVDAERGAEIYRVSIDRSTQGYMATTGDRLILPTGRTAPALFNRTDGKLLGDVRSPGGSFAIAAHDLVAAGSGDGAGEVIVSDRQSLKRLVSFKGLHLLVADDRFFVHSREGVSALDWTRYADLLGRQAEIQAQVASLKRREDDQSKSKSAQLEDQLRKISGEIESCWLWRSECREPFAAILAGDVLFTGGDGTVAAYAADDGRRVWSADVEGSAYGLSVANGQLLVSTSAGVIFAFRPDDTEATERTSAHSSDTRNTDAAKEDRAQEDADAARQILAASETDQGICVILPTGRHRLANEIVSNSRMRTICLAADAIAGRESRQYLLKAGAYGKQVVVHRGDLATLNNYPPYFANLVVVDSPVPDGHLASLGKQIRRVLRPCGGMCALTARSSIPQPDLQAWLDRFPGDRFQVDREPGGLLLATIRRGPLPGSGEWTHGLADPGNTACSEDQRIAGPLQIQWFGAPGPRPMTDRHHRNVTPLYGDGRLFVPGEDLVIAVDAYNGTTLWQRRIVNSLRLGAFLDCSNMVLDRTALNVVSEAACHRLDLRTGKPIARIDMPQIMDDGPRHWGYVARTDDLIIGSGRKPNATYREQSWDADNALWYDNMSLVTSDYLFAVHPDSGEVSWTYASGSVLNTTITIGGGRLYFLESHSPAALGNTSGRMPMATFLDGPNFLVALDLKTGDIAWRREIDLANCRLIAYLSYAQEKLILSGNKYIDNRLWYAFVGIDAANGQSVWQRSHNSGYAPRGGHGEQNRHPTIVGDTVYAYPLAYKLHTGEPVDGWRFSRSGHGCGNISASAKAMFWRGGNPWRRDLDADASAAPINRVTRPGCWINIIPAGGLVMIPEASSGCTCAFPLQTSLTYVPTQDASPALPQ